MGDRTGTRSAVWWFAASGIALLGCQQPGAQRPPNEVTTRNEAEVVLQHSQGGILVLKGNREAAQEDADKKMAAHCKGPYRILSEENVAVGAETPATMSKPRPITQFRITYRCASPENSAAPPPR